MSESFSFRWASATLKTPGMLAALAAGAAVVVLGWGVYAITTAFLSPKPGQLQSTTVDKEQAAKQSALFEGYLAQINGRSLLITPGAPVAEAPPVVADTTPKDPPKPSSYGGPALTAMMLDSAWFADGARLKAGGDGKGDLKVLSLNPPWEVRVEWRGVEFNVPLFDRDKVVFKDIPPAPTTSPATKPEQPAPSDQSK
ncbi:MAG: hypothetical protein ACOYN0_02115 [Phycisphaerales bacterium]